MAPEVVSGHLYSEKSESWGLGCIAHELATLQPTFYVHGDDEYQLNRRIKHLAYPRIPTQYGDVLKDLITGCFTINPDRRLGMKDILDNPYVVESRCQRQLAHSKVKWEAERREREEQYEVRYRRHEKGLQGREKNLADRAAATQRAAVEIQGRERALYARDLAFTGRELFIRQQENAVREDRTKWQQERAAMEERRAKIKAEEEVVQVARAQVEKEFEARRAELEKLEQSVKEEQKSLDRHQAQRKKAWASRTDRFKVKKANLAAEVQKQVDKQLSRKTKSAVRDAKKEVYRAKTSSQVERNSVATALVDTASTPTATISGRGTDVLTNNKPLPTLWQTATSANPNSMPMELGDTFYIKNNLVRYPDDGEDRAGNKCYERDEDIADRMEVGQSFYVRNA